MDDKSKVEVNQKSLSQKYKNFFDIGVSVEGKYLDTYSSIIMQHFSTITPENAFKFENIHPKRDMYSFDEADALVMFAKNNNKAVRGHTLLWHEQLPDWIKQELLQGNSNELIWRMIESHISTVLERYKDTVYCWDLINEVLADEGEFLRDTVWLKVFGQNYIEKVFEMVKGILPDGKFFINEYNIHVPEKRKRMERLLNKLEHNGFRVDGVGIQGHYNITYPTIEMIKEELKFYSYYGVEVHVTELDISLYDYFDRRIDLQQPTSEMEKKQEELYGRLFELYREYSHVIGNVTVWGVSDKTTWLNDYPVKNRKDWPLLFDDTNRPKKALDRIMEF